MTHLRCLERRQWRSSAAFCDASSEEWDGVRVGGRCAGIRRSTEAPALGREALPTAISGLVQRHMGGTRQLQVGRPVYPRSSSAPATARAHYCRHLVLAQLPYPNDLPEFAAARRGNWRERHLPGSPGMGGRCHCQDWRQRCMARIASGQPVRARSRLGTSRQSGLMLAISHCSSPSARMIS